MMKIEIADTEQDGFSAAIALRTFSRRRVLKCGAVAFLAGVVPLGALGEEKQSGGRSVAVTPKRNGKILHREGVEIETYIDGKGPALVVLPSYGRGSGEDYDVFVAQVVAAGFTVLRPQPRGIAGSKGPWMG